FFKAVFFKEVKKRYAYWCTFEDGKECDYIGFKGFELVRGDSSPFIKRMQEEMFEIILKKDPSELVSWLPKIVKEFRSAKLSEIAIPKGLNKSFDSYDSMQSFVRGAIYANTYLGETITPGRTVYMLYVRSVKGKPRTDVVSLSSPEKFDELADIIEVDWDRMIEFSIRNKVEEIFKKFGLPFSISGRQLTL
ncbi:MAG: DNA polymerase domain-containing protein, partial [Candidatus Thorarchaeota archaeon]